MNKLNDELLKWIRDGNLKMTQHLLRSGADVHYQDDHALLISINTDKDNADILKELLKYNADVHTRDDHALIFSVMRGNLDIVTELLKHGANVHSRNDAALRASVYYYWPAIIAVLLEYGADMHYDNDKIFRIIERHFKEGVDSDIDEEFVNIIFSYCTDNDYHHFPDAYVKAMITQTKSANKM